MVVFWFGTGRDWRCGVVTLPLEGEEWACYVCMYVCMERLRGRRVEGFLNRRGEKERMRFFICDKY